MRGQKVAARDRLRYARRQVDRVRESSDARNAFDMPTSWWVAGLLAIGVGVTALFGGLGPASARVAAAEPDAPLRNEIVSVQVHEAWLTQEIEGTFTEADDGNTLIVVTFTVTNLWDEPLGMSNLADRVEADVVGGDRALIQVGGIPGDIRPDFTRTDGSRGIVYLQPALPVEVTGVWEVASADVPDELTLTVHAAKLRRGSVLIANQKQFWDPGVPLAVMTVPLREGDPS